MPDSSPRRASATQKARGVAGCPCPVKFFCWPCLLSWLSCKLLCLPCLATYCVRFWRCCICACCKYNDKSFPPDGKSLGGEFAADRGVEWVRAPDLHSGNEAEMVLFQGSIEPSDVCQGGIGNCWLMSAFACMAEYPGALQNIFHNRERSRRGKYTVTLYENGQPVDVTVDDRIPCKNGRPLFAKPNGHEMWVMLLEKAVAKFCGSYDKLQGGITCWGLGLLTGDPGFRLKQEEMRNARSKWNRVNLEVSPSPEDKRRCFTLATNERYEPEKLFDIMFEYNKKHALLAASAHAAKSDSQADSKRGIVQSHAYTIVDVRIVDGHKLLQLRNPWGSFEWTGKWSDDSEEWKKHPKVAQAVGFTAANDGLFWMEADDFFQMYDTIDVVDRSVGEHDVALRIDEEGGFCGPCCGCVRGCCRFWCCCGGCRVLCCSRRGTGQTREGNRGCCSDG
eukprot:TRINITY_DN55929_c0_g1_i1.p2 TRINITY_DN55929_c0_g1~~TRINITY_DN55929_c0_g1_i1.p2  ORF type:complete len:469 (+),score=151.93 TRINITY_DN55929_c0_g1_i1:63-1409(+)